MLMHTNPETVSQLLRVPWCYANIVTAIAQIGQGFLNNPSSLGFPGYLFPKIMQAKQNSPSKEGEYARHGKSFSNSILNVLSVDPHLYLRIEVFTRTYILFIKSKRSLSERLLALSK